MTDKKLKGLKKTIKLSDYVVKYLAEIGVRHVFLMSGGANMHLTDSVGRNKSIKYICLLHEQAIAMAVEGYARLKNDIGVAVVTSGPSATNTITGVAGAWIDSTPCMFISGQVNLEDTIGDKPLRQVGLQEISIVDIVKPITKYAIMIDDPYSIRFHLEKAVWLARKSRPGPVWIDIPLNIQGAMIEENKLLPFNSVQPHPAFDQITLKEKVTEIIEMLKKSRRPVLLAGNGIRLARGQKEFTQLVEKLRIPVLTTWGAADLIDENHNLFIGRPGLFGQRGANFAIQNSDLLLCIGTRLSIPQTGYNYRAFARAARIIMVDICAAELENARIHVDLPINCDAKCFLKETIHQLSYYEQDIKIDEWVKKCRNWKLQYPVVLKEYFAKTTPVNSYVFVDVLSDELNNKDVVVTDMGTSFTCTFQTFRVKKGQRFFTSSGLAPMGFGLPGSIGACFANDRRRTICISGDGGLQMNMQELQTLVHHNLSIKVFVLNNRGYLAVKHHQDSNFKGYYVGAGRTSGVSFPDTIKVARAYGIKTEKISSHRELRKKIRSVLEMKGPVVCEVIMPEDQLLGPRLASKLQKDGTMRQTPLEDMYPFLEREEFLQNMIIPPL